jgi:hypothetical protein
VSKEKFKWREMNNVYAMAMNNLFWLINRQLKYWRAMAYKQNWGYQSGKTYKEVWNGSEWWENS